MGKLRTDPTRMMVIHSRGQIDVKLARFREIVEEGDSFPLAITMQRMDDLGRGNEGLLQRVLAKLEAQPQQVAGEPTDEQIETLITAIQDRVEWLEIGVDDARYILEMLALGGDDAN